MLESYVTPILMSYVNRYIKNLKPSDLQLSLWGGDVVLSKLELKLDVLEQELKLPFTFLSGHIHELRIHVPWTKLGSEPVVITINTMECILKLKDGAQQEDHESCGSSSTNRSTTESLKSAVKSRRVQQSASPDPDLPPGYVQSLIRRVVNNVNIVINNLILKYVEDDIVLSVNITSAECYTVDEFWDRAFMDISATDLVLRKMINFSDCTVCLDKRNASGKIEFYQEPLLYKCSFRTRLHFTYDNLNSKMPSIIKIHTLVESLKLSISDQQLPMFIRIMQLGIALYYGEIGSFKDGESEDLICHTKDMLGNITGTEDEASSVMQYPTQYISQDPYFHQDDDQQQGWVSWAWSFVPAIVSYDDEENGSGGIGDGTAEQQKSQSLKDPIISVGFYCTKATVTFKLTEMQAESSYYSPQKVKSKEVICWEQEGTTVEVLMKGELFFDCQIGFVGCQAMCLKGIMGIKDFEENMNRSDEEACFFSCGENLSVKGMTYLTNSLFDYRSPENNSIRAEFILDAAHHKETYTEIAGMQRFGAFYMDYLYTMESTGGKVSGNQQDHSSVKSEDFGNVQEMSTKSLIVGPLNLRLDSSAVHRIMKMIVCALEHEYEPYSRTKPDITDGSRTMPSSEEVASLEEYIPTRLTTFTVLKCTIIIPVAEFNLLDHLLPIIMGEKNLSGLLNAASFQPLRPLPSIRILVDKVNLEHSVPMYAEQLVHVVSSLSQPSDNLLHYCYSHCYLKIFGFQAALTSLDSKGLYCIPVPVIPSFSTAVYGKLIKFPKYWSKRAHVPLTECIFELPNLTVQATRAQTLLLQTIYQSWCHPVGNVSSVVVNEALLNEVFQTSGVKSKNPLPTLEGSIQNVELKYCGTSLVKCASGTVGSIKICAKAPGDGGKEKLIPLIQGPSDTRDLHSSKWLNESRKPESLLAPDLVAFTIQIPQYMDYCHNSGAVLLSSVQGLAINVDPVLYTWLIYQPQKRVSRHIQQQSVGAVPLGVSVTRKKEDEASVGSAPLARQQSNQASEYASSPVKTKTVTESRPLSLPVKTVLNSSENCRSPEERMKEFIGIVWNAVKCLTLQLEVQSCCVFLPNDSLPSPSTIVSGDIPGTVRNWYHGQASMPGTLVVCLPQIKIMSAGHKHMEPLQEIPFVVLRPILEEGDAFPWTISLHHFSVYTLLGQQMTLNLVEPMGCTSTLAVTSQKLLASGPESRHSFVVCLHVDLESLEIKCSNPQVQLLYELAEITSKVWNKIQRKGVLYQSVSSVYTETMTGPVPPSSPVKSSVGTIPPDTSTYSPSADIGTTTEGDSLQGGDDSPFSDSITLEQTTSNIGVSSGRVSLWMQWMLPKITVKLFAPDPRNNGTEVCIVSELEDLSASVDMQDVYTKIKCKIESFNIDHYRNSLGEDSWSLGQYGGVFLSCTDKLNRRTLLVRPISKQDPFNNFSGFFPSTTAKLLDGSHQQHGFLSLTYTKAVTKNVRHKLISRNERRTFHKLSEGHTDGSPHFLHEILLSAQAFDVVLCFPLLNAIASIFQARLPRSQKEKRKSPGQPMRTHALTSRNLPLIYINTGVIRVFFPKNEEDHHIAEANPSIKEDTLVLKIGSVSMAPQADNPLSRAVLRKDIYQRALNLGILRDPGSEVEDRQYQIDLQSINIGTAYWNQLKPEKESGKGGVLTETERNSQNPALEWNMASSIRRHQERRAILTPILTDFTVRITAAPAIIFTKIDAAENLHTEEILVCGHSLEVNMTTSLDFFLNVAQVQLLQQLVQANMVGLEASSSTTEVSKQEQKKMDVADGGTVETSSRYSGAQDSGIGSDSVKIRIIQIEQHSGTSQHRIARPSRQSSIVKNLNFIPFDIFVTASRISLMTYSCTASPKSKSVQDQKDGEKMSKSSLNLPETVSGSSHDTKKPSQPCISSVTADDLLNSNPPLSAGRKPGLLSLESLHASTRSSARQALGITIVRQPGRRGAGDIELQPFLYLVLSQPSVLLSCHHRKQKVEISVFDAGLKGVASDYKCTDPGKTLPEALDYCKVWLQTVAGEVDAKSGIPPPLITVQIKDFLNGPADINVDISKPLKANLSFARLDQINQFLKKIITTNEDVSRKEAASSAGIIPDEDITLISRHPSTKDFLPAAHTSTVQKASMQENLWQALSCFQKISIHTVQMVVLMETIPHPSKPCLLVSFSNLSGSLNIKSGHKTAGIHGSSLVLDIKDFLLKTSLKERAKSLIGPFCCSINVEAKWCKHSGDPGPEQSVPKIYIDLRGGLLQVFWGQEHLNCLVLLQELLWQYLSKKGSVETLIAERTHPKCFSAERSPASKPEHTSDDLRTGLFQYIQDAEAQKLPNAYEVVFYNETEDSPGMMLWRYPEPRVLTLVKINPVPFNTTEDPDISTADLGDVLQVPCSLEYWDELQKSFVAFREFSLSESKVCELQLPSISLVNDQKELIASDLWRIVLNSSQNVADDQSSESESGSQSMCDQLVTPTALAACTRVDSCFTPWFVPSLSVLIQFTCLEVHLCHHLDQLGTAPPRFLQPFLSDKNMPSELEYMIVSFDEPHVYLRQWNDESVFQEIQFSTQADCKLLECRNVTMQSVVKPFKIWGQIAVSSSTAGRLFDCTIMVDPIFISFGQYALHSLNTAIQAWQQNRCPEAEEFVFSHFVICNDTQETLRFGQVDTDENILLATLHSHQYSWRSHKSPQLLHICIEGWGNWRWSEPFSVDNTGTFIRTIQYKGRTASLIIKVQQLSGVQKQILICGRQTFCSYLSESIELKVVQHYISQDGQAVVKEHINCLAAKQKLPSYILENNELTELSVKSTGDEDWSQDVCLSSKHTEHSTVIQVPSSNSSITYVWCTVLTLEPNSHVQQRLIVFSPLFIVRSHLPDPIILHIEKRSLGLNETQVIPGKGQEKALQNIEPDLTHHLTFQAREEDDPSECAVPISTTLIKQIATKSSPGGSVSQVLSEFYGIASPPQPAWPYNRKDSDSNEQLSQWDSPMRVKLSVWKPYVRTLLIELLPWALLINQSKWDLWLFEGEKILLQVPSGKVIIPPNFEEAFQVGIYWANTNTVHKSVAIKLVHNVTSPKWKDADNGEVVTLDEEGFVEAEIKLGAFPGHQKLCEFCISSMVRQGIQILQIEDKTTIINDTSYQIYYRPQLVISKSHSEEEDFQCPDGAVFSLGPAGAGCSEAPSAVPCWDLLWEPGASAAGPSLGDRRLVLGFSGAGSRPLWSLPAAVSAELARQSVAVPTGARAESGFCTRAIALTYQEHLGVTYLTLTEDPSPRIIIHNRCSIPLLVKENFKDTPKFEVYCRKIPAECSVHHELYHQISSYPDCKTRDLLPSILLKVVSSDELVNEWSDVVDINNQGTQIVFLTGFGCVYVDITHHCGTIVITLAPEGRAGPAGINLNRSQEQTLSLKMFISQLSLAAFDDITNHKVSSELLRLTADNVFLHMAPGTSSLSQEFQQDSVEGLPLFHSLQVYCEDLQLDNQLYSKSNFHFAVLLCQEEKTETAQWSRMNNLIVCNKDLESYKENCFIKLCIAFSEEENFMFHVNDLSFELKPARLYVEDTFVYYIKTLFDTYLPENKTACKSMNASDTTLIVPEQVREHARALVKPVKLRRLKIQPVNLLVSIHASLKLYIASDHTPLSFSVFERGPIFTTARQLVHALAMHYAAGALFRAGWVVGSLEILGSPASLVRSIGNGIADFFRLPYEGLTRGPGAFVSGVSRGTTSFVKHISKGTLTSITNLATSLARNMDRLSLDEEHYNRQEEWRRQLPESLGEGLRQGLSRLGISLLGAIAGIVDQPMRNFQRVSEAQASAGHKARGVISGVGKGIMGVFTKPIGGAAELVSQTGYGILHGAGLSQLPKQRSRPDDQHVEQAPNSHVKYVWKMLQSLGRPEVHMALDVMIVSGSGQQHEGCLLLTSEVLFVVSISEDTQQQAFPVTEIDCLEDDQQKDLLKVQLKQQRVPSDLEAEGARERLSEQQYNRLVEYITKTSCHLAPSTAAAPAPQAVAAEQPLTITKTYQYVVDPNFAQVFISKFTMVKNKALRKGFN
ncbi:vacuolar protein sorting-associated protein 13B isoform X1 [Onychostruthus taczanowskii]|uniref:vacuolar protein sorting-associated protein 13B isoform X1 n=2 Tax=Onychostruthus taczanowskii TaxID=356909 RepID=UPI001B803AD8|nr:vacuolar protein sorting-associated protein 13B isoform X1 [Onychostruthus taczanowskii]XP_041269032.1 vacuolar protein sorting-associated protein 13B isoform X1 [Onychostruthus taczanowskii]